MNKETKKAIYENIVIVTTSVLLILGALMLAIQNVRGFIPITLGVVLVITSLKKIEPIHKGIILFLGKRTVGVKDEGWRFAKIPFLLDVQPVLMKLRDLDLKFTGVLCNNLGTGELMDEPKENGVFVFQAGGFVTVQVQVSWKPDENRLIQFDNVGEENGVHIYLDGVLGDFIRQIGRWNTWQRYCYSPHEVALVVIKKLTGVEPAPNESPAQFITRCVIKGMPDCHNLGILFTKISISAVEPEGELRADSERAAREEQQRLAETEDMKTSLAVAGMVQKSFPNADFRTILNFVQAERGRAQKIVVDTGESGGSSNALVALLAAQVATELGKKGPKK